MGHRQCCIWSDHIWFRLQKALKVMQAGSLLGLSENDWTCRTPKSTGDICFLSWIIPVHCPYLHGHKMLYLYITVVNPYFQTHLGTVPCQVKVLPATFSDLDGLNLAISDADLLGSFGVGRMENLSSDVIRNIEKRSWRILKFGMNSSLLMRFPKYKVSAFQESLKRTKWMDTKGIHRP